MYLIKRNRVYHMYYQDQNGTERTKSTKCSTKGDAYRFATAFLKSLESKQIELTKQTFGQYQIFYLNYASKRFTPNYQAFIKYAFSQFGRVIPSDKPLNEIRTSDIESFISLKLNETKEHIINGYLRTLQGAFQRGVELGYLGENIFTRIKKLKIAENPPVFLKENEFEKIITVESDTQLKSIYTFAYYTGMRMSEIRFLRWESIDFEKNLITVKNHNEFTTKSKRSRTIPLHPKLRTLLESENQKNDRDSFVFIRNTEVVKKNFLTSRFKRAVRLAKLSEKYHFHSLRHTFASNLVQKGVSIYLVSKLLGHSNIKTTEIYAHLRIDDLQKVVNFL